MSKFVWLMVAVATTATFVAAAWADVPAPPVNQTLGFKDGTTNTQDASVCAGCHPGDQGNRHHVLYGTALPSAGLWYSSRDPGAPDPVPYAYAPYTSRSPNPTSTTASPPGRDTKFNCFDCHSASFIIPKNAAGLTNCPSCHQRSPHHAALNEPIVNGVPTGADHKCTPCHGNFVSDYNDGHYIPSYTPSLVTPRSSRGTGLPLNSRGNGAGACNYCHDADLLSTHVIGDNHNNHHLIEIIYSGKCAWCHGAGHGPPDNTQPYPYTLRNSATDPLCENCHGPATLHNIQASSKTPPGPVVVGGELAGYGHVGLDAYDPSKPNGNSDCWGCHGFAMTSSAPDTGPLVPTIYDASRTAITAGKATSVVLTGAVFTNTGDNSTVYNSTVTLTAANGTSVTLKPDAIVNQGSLAVTIPAGTKAGKYTIRAQKSNFASNPAPLTVLPQVSIGKAVNTTAVPKTVTITGNGFAGFQKGSGLFVKATTATGATAAGTIVSWAPTKIVVKFTAVPTKVTVKSVFGTATHVVTK
jgi:hypothetical protein